MGNNDTVYITGHMHPDTDSIASAIAYAFFKRAMGIRAVPCRLGRINAESEYLLKRFGFETPVLLKDARVSLSEIQLDPPISILPDKTIYEALELMQQSGKTCCGVVDGDQRLVGLVTKSDIAAVGLGDTAYNNNILNGTPVENIRKTISGRTLYDCAETHMNGQVSIVAMTEPEYLRAYDVRDRIVVIGRNTEAQKELIRRGAGMLIVVWAEEVDEAVLKLAEENRCPVILSGLGVTNTARYLYFTPPVSKLMKEKVVRFKDGELAEDVGVKMLRTRYHVYPVVDQAGRLTGYVSRYHIMNAENKKLILVDHNEFAQSVRAANEARVLEVIDHHRINDFSTTQPVAFRNEIVGSTATIIATIFRENQIPIPPNLAGLLLGALLSDTMDFHSPTTTDRDRSTANILAAMADLDIEEFARDLFAVTSNNTGKSLNEVISQDIKFYEIEGCKLAVSQIIVESAVARSHESAAIQPAVDSYAVKKNLDLMIVVFTSIVENGSVIYYAGKRSGWAQEAFPDKEGEEHSLQENLMSRKQQILPGIAKIIEQYS